MKNKKYRFVFKDVDDKKFRKIHKYLTRLEDVSSVKKMIKIKKKLEEAGPAPEPEEVPEQEPEEDYGEQGSPEEYYEE